METALADAKTTLTGDAGCDGAECREGAADDGEPQAGGGDVQGQCSGRQRSSDGWWSGCRTEEAKKDEGVIDAEYVDADHK